MRSNVALPVIGALLIAGIVTTVISPKLWLGQILCLAALAAWAILLAIRPQRRSADSDDVERRLATLAELHATQAISSAEHDERRRQILDGV